MYDLCLKTKKIKIKIQTQTYASFEWRNNNKIVKRLTTVRHRDGTDVKVHIRNGLILFHSDGCP